MTSQLSKFENALLIAKKYAKLDDDKVAWRAAVQLVQADKGTAILGLGADYKREYDKLKSFGGKLRKSIDCLESLPERARIYLDGVVCHDLASHDSRGIDAEYVLKSVLSACDARIERIHKASGEGKQFSQADLVSESVYDVAHRVWKCITNENPPSRVTTPNSVNGGDPLRKQTQFTGFLLEVFALHGLAPQKIQSASTNWANRRSPPKKQGS